jgi:hypothetical protein
VTIGFLVTSPDQGPSSLIDQFGLVARSMMEAKNDGGHYVLGDLNCCKNVLIPFPRSVPRHNGFCSDMHCQLWDLI